MEATHPNACGNYADRLMKYEPLEHIVLGRGAHTLVFKGHDTHNNRPVAIKCLEPGADNDATWERVAFAAGHMNRSLVHVWDIERLRGWVVLELMSCSLQRFLDGNPLDPEQAPHILQDALEGLNYLHGKGIVHGAIKPSNVLLDAQARAKLADAHGYELGSAWRIPSHSDAFVPPELLQSRFGEVGPGSDLFCLADTMLRALLGRKFEAAVRGQKLGFGARREEWRQWLASTTTSYPDVQRLVPRLDAATARVLTRMLNKPVALRYAAAEQAILDLIQAPGVVVSPADNTNTGSKASTSFSVSGLGQLKHKGSTNVRVLAAPGGSVSGAHRGTRGSGHDVPLEWGHLRRTLTSRVTMKVLMTTLVLAMVCALCWPSPQPKLTTVRVYRNEKSQIRYGQVDSPDASLLAEGAHFLDDSSEDIDLPLQAIYRFEVVGARGNLIRGQTVTIEEAMTVDLTYADNKVDRAPAPSVVKYSVEVFPATATDILLNGKSVIDQFHADADRLAARLELKKNEVGRLLIKAPGYQDLQAQLRSMSNGRPQELRLQQIRQVIVRSDVATQVQVHFNQQTAVVQDGHVVFNWPAGADVVHVWVTCEGYQATPEDITLEEIDVWPHVVDLQLEKLAAPPQPEYSLLGIPPGGVIRLDKPLAPNQVVVGSGPTFNFDEEGMHLVTVTAPGYERWQMALDLRAGGSHTVVMRPTPKPVRRRVFPP